MRPVHSLVQCESARFDSRLFPGHHCQSQGEGALNAVDLHVLSLLFLLYELHSLMRHGSLSFTGDFTFKLLLSGRLPPFTGIAEVTRFERPLTKISAVHLV